MKPLAAILLAGAVLAGGTACGAAKEPEPVKAITVAECSKLTFDMLKEKFGVDFLIKQKDEANAIVLKTCKNQPLK